MLRTMKSFGHFSSIWINQTYINKQPLTLQEYINNHASHLAVSLPLLSVAACRLPSTRGSGLCLHTDSGQQLRTESTLDILKLTLLNKQNANVQNRYVFGHSARSARFVFQHFIIRSSV